MIDFRKLEELYSTIAEDLNITNFGNESTVDFHNRIIYSAIGKWVMQLFADRDFEDNELDEVSKSHVTISALEILNSYKKIDGLLSTYFIDDKRFINDIENIYVALGYINSEKYVFKYPICKNRVVFSKKTLVIDLDANAKKMRGLGVWGKYDETSDMPLEEFLLNTSDAYTSFRNLASKLSYKDFNSSLGKIELYNTNKKRWEYFNEKAILNYEYYILKIDDGLDYQILKRYDSKYFVASVPTLYTKKSNDDIFLHEIWRIILGLCSYNNTPAKCFISKYHNYGIKISFNGYILPYFEYSLLKCMAWPLGNSNGINDFVSSSLMKKSLVKILNHLSIDIIEEGAEQYGEQFRHKKNSSVNER